eukprot:1193540-Prorocentrum_minimum.AAC.2
MCRFSFEEGSLDASSSGKSPVCRGASWLVVRGDWGVLPELLGKGALLLPTAERASPVSRVRISGWKGLKHRRAVSANSWGKTWILQSVRNIFWGRIECAPVVKWVKKGLMSVLSPCEGRRRG